MTLDPEELPPEDSLVCYYTEFEQLLDLKLLITHAYWILKAKGHVFCEHVFGAWTLAMRNLPSSACSPSLLRGCLALLGSLWDFMDLMQNAEQEIFDRDFENRFKTSTTSNGQTTILRNSSREHLLRW